MIIFKQEHSVRKHLQNQTQPIHFVPTMGALHEGHISLIEKAKTSPGLVVCSIFINPTQFNNTNDFKHYPVTIDSDIRLLEEAGCDVLFLPSVDTIYPEGTDYTIDIELGNNEHILEGLFRKGHFAGVIQVVNRLLEIIRPQVIYLGEKDLQQIQVITQLRDQKHPHLQIVPCPTLRDSDGLAMSSRNKRLTAAQRAVAPEIYKNLKKISENASQNTFDTLKANAVTALEKSGYTVDYISLVDTEKWVLIDDFNESRMAVLIAAYLGEVRLIDNILFYKN